MTKSNNGKIIALGELEPQFPEDNSHWVGDNSILVGDVRLGQNVGIWYGSVLRGDNEPIIIGDDTNVQEHSICHTDMGYPLIIGKGCTIGHRALLHGCIIGDNSLIGMGAVIMNGVKIGNNCLVAANALVTEGREFPDGSLVVGSPAKVVRQLTTEEIAKLCKSADHYVGAMNRIKTGGRLVSL